MAPPYAATPWDRVLNEANGTQAALPTGDRLLPGDWLPALREWHGLLKERDGAVPPRPAAYLVGGVLRDALLGRAPVDIDVTLAHAEPVEPARVLAGMVRGTAVVLDPERRMVRVAAARLQPPHLDLTPLRGAILADLQGRDFTCNALALPLEAAFGADWRDHLIDPFGGRADLESRRLRMLRDDVFREDPVRLLRAARVAAELGLTVEPGTEEAIVRHASALSESSAERVRDELVRLLLVPHAAQWLDTLDRWDLLCRVLPELAPGKGVMQPVFHFWDVFQHSLHAVEAIEVLLTQPAALDLVIEPAWRPAIETNLSEELGGGRPRLASLKLATLLHDVGKPKTKTVEPDGRTRFFGHAERGAAMAAQAMERLRFSRREIEAVQLLIREHLRPTMMGRPPSERALYRFFRDLGEEAYALLLLHVADARATHGPSLDGQAWRDFLRGVGDILRWRFVPPRMEAPRRLIDGHTLMAALNLPPGPQIGRLLEAIDEAYALSQVHTAEEALRYVAGLVHREPVVAGQETQ